MILINWYTDILILILILITPSWQTQVIQYHTLPAIKSFNSFGWSNITPTVIQYHTVYIFNPHLYILLPFNSFGWSSITPTVIKCHTVYIHTSSLQLFWVIQYHTHGDPVSHRIHLHLPLYILLAFNSFGWSSITPTVIQHHTVYIHTSSL